MTEMPNGELPVQPPKGPKAPRFCVVLYGTLFTVLGVGLLLLGITLTIDTLRFGWFQSGGGLGFNLSQHHAMTSPEGASAPATARPWTSWLFWPLEKCGVIDDADYLGKVLVNLDLTAVSGILLIAVGSSLLIYGYKVIGWWRNPRRGWPEQMFPRRMRRLSIELGFLGTIAVFLLYYVVSLRTPASPAPQSATDLSPPAATADATPSPTTEPASPSRPAGISPNRARRGDDLFLLLAMSLVSTFLGCTAGFLLVPYGEDLNRWFGRVEDTSATDQEHRYAQSLGTASDSLDSLTDKLKGIDQASFPQFVKDVHTLAVAVGTIQASQQASQEESRNLAAAITQAATSMQESLKHLKKLPTSIDEATAAAREANQDALAELARSRKELTAAMTKLVKMARQVVKPTARIVALVELLSTAVQSVSDSLSRVSREDKELTGQVAELKQAIVDCTLLLASTPENVAQQSSQAVLDAVENRFAEIERRLTELPCRMEPHPDDRFASSSSNGRARPWWPFGKRSR